MAAAPPLHTMLEPLSWLLGKWTSDSGLATYPTMQPFQFRAEVEFSHIGQPNIHFSSVTWAAGGEKKPLHRETGFIRLHPDTRKVAFICAQNIGLSTMEEGTLSEAPRLSLDSSSVARMTFIKGTETKAIQRTFELDGENLVQTVAMETNKTPMTHHLKISYKRVQP